MVLGRTTNTKSVSKENASKGKHASAPATSGANSTVQFLSQIVFQRLQILHILAVCHDHPSVIIGLPRDGGRGVSEQLGGYLEVVGLVLGQGGHGTVAQHVRAQRLAQQLLTGG